MRTAWCAIRRNVSSFIIEKDTTIRVRWRRARHSVCGARVRLRFGARLAAESRVMKTLARRVSEITLAHAVERVANRASLTSECGREYAAKHWTAMSIGASGSHHRPTGRALAYWRRKAWVHGRRSNRTVSPSQKGTRYAAGQPSATTCARARSIRFCFDDTHGPRRRGTKSIDPRVNARKR